MQNKNIYTQICLKRQQKISPVSATGQIESKSNLNPHLIPNKTKNGTDTVNNENRDLSYERDIKRTESDIIFSKIDGKSLIPESKPSKKKFKQIKSSVNSKTSLTKNEHMISILKSKKEPIKNADRQYDQLLNKRISMNQDITEEKNFRAKSLSKETQIRIKAQLINSVRDKLDSIDLSKYVHSDKKLICKIDLIFEEGRENPGNDFEIPRRIDEGREVPMRTPNFERSNYPFEIGRMRERRLRDFSSEMINREERYRLKRVNRGLPNHGWPNHFRRD